MTRSVGASMYGLLGPNGPGKSTPMRGLATLQEPDAGTVRLGDLDVVSQKNRRVLRRRAAPDRFFAVLTHALSGRADRVAARN